MERRKGKGARGYERGGRGKGEEWRKRMGGHGRKDWGHPPSRNPGYAHVLGGVHTSATPHVVNGRFADPNTNPNLPKFNHLFCRP